MLVSTSCSCLTDGRLRDAPHGILMSGCYVSVTGMRLSEHAYVQGMQLSETHVSSALAGRNVKASPAWPTTCTTKSVGHHDVFRYDIVSLEKITGHEDEEGVRDAAR